MSMSLSRRLSRLEEASAGSCPSCAGRPYITLRDDQPVPYCEVCRQPLPAVRIVRDPNFYGNRQRLDEVNHAAV
jgi:hypothetical protein